MFQPLTTFLTCPCNIPTNSIEQNVGSPVAAIMLIIFKASLLSSDICVLNQYSLEMCFSYVVVGWSYIKVRELFNGRKLSFLAGKALIPILSYIILYLHMTVPQRGTNTYVELLLGRVNFGGSSLTSICDEYFNFANETLQCYGKF